MSGYVNKDWQDLVRPPFCTGIAINTLREEGSGHATLDSHVEKCRHVVKSIVKLYIDLVKFHVSQSSTGFSNRYIYHSLIHYYWSWPMDVLCYSYFLELRVVHVIFIGVCSVWVLLCIIGRIIARRICNFPVTAQITRQINVLPVYFASQNTSESFVLRSSVTFRLPPDG